MKSQSHDTINKISYRRFHMIPLKLQIKNFLSYGAELQTIDFSNYPLICLSGKNGHGKSALLDAITWAIWGQARKIINSSKADQGLLHLGQHTMMVIIDFECNKTIYRIRREYSHNFGKPYATLEFGIIQNDEKTLIPLTDKTIRATQHKIEQTLRLDFNTFINSAFLRQGSSNEFSKKSPKERKDVLASILGLHHYESIRKLACEKTKQLSIEKMGILTLQQKYDEELQTLANLNEQICQINEKISSLTDKEKNIFSEQEKVELKRVKLIQEQNNYKLILLKKEQLSKQEQDYKEHVTTKIMEWRGVQRQKKHLPLYQNIETKKNQLTIELQGHQIQVQQLLNIKEEYLANKSKLATIEHNLRLEHYKDAQQKQLYFDRLKNEHQQVINFLSRQQDEEQILFKEQQTLYEKNVSLKKDVEGIVSILNQKRIIEKQFDRRKEYYHRFVAQGNGLKNELDNLEQKQQLVHEDNDPSCPLCEQNLSTSRKKFLKNKYSAQKKFLIHRITRLSRIIKQLKDLLFEHHSWLENSKQIENKHASIQATIHETEKQRVSVEEKIARVKQEIKITNDNNQTLLNTLLIEEKKISAKIDFNESILMNNNEYASIYQIYQVQEQQIKDLDMHMKKQRTIHDTIKNLESELNEYRHLNEQVLLQGQRATEINKLCNNIRALRKALADLSMEEKQYHYLNKEKDDLQSQIQNYIVIIQEVRKERENFLQQKGNLEAQKTKLLQIEQEYKNQREQLKTLNETIDDYTIIAQSTGKDGIQALLIEDAIPEIEQEANYLLSKLTDNQAHLSIESLRDLKKGGTKETLDIKISDAIGIRPYELFSGGEAFRIDFALRIAISKLLARRAGTALQTLIIDEGFGSQDEEGLHHIMDAIYKIQENFERIIIVSHLSSMKEQFPVHFVIEKGSQGSIVNIVEQE